MQSESFSGRRQILILTGLMIAAFLFRFLPYVLEKNDSNLWAIWGANPVWAMFLLCVAKCRWPRLGLLIPLSGFIVTDIVIHYLLAAQGISSGSLSGRILMYALFIILSQLGLILRYLRLPTMQSLAASLSVGLFGSLLFFLITNFIIWLRVTPATPAPYNYPKNWEGLLQCYEMAVPFFRNQLVGDALFILALFGTYALLERLYVLNPEPKRQAITV